MYSARRVESLRGVFSRRNGNGDDTGQVFSELDYAQIDWLADTHVMPVAGKFILPYGLVTERLDPIWIDTFSRTSHLRIQRALKRLDLESAASCEA